MGVPEIRSHVWIWWAQIAIDQEALARTARERALALPSHEEPFGLEFMNETYASMIAVSAAAHSLDAIYGVLKPVSPPATAENRRGQILESLKANFYVRGSAGGGRWAKEFKWLFDLRDGALHFGEASKPTVPHPTGVHTSVENVDHSLESAERAVNLMLEVLDVCTTAPRPALTSWSEVMRPSVVALTARRADLEGTTSKDDQTPATTASD